VVVVVVEVKGIPGWGRGRSRCGSQVQVVARQGKPSLNGQSVQRKNRPDQTRPLEAV
jgi:hypothetical protein